MDDLSNEYPNFAQKIQLNTYRIIILITFQFPRNIVIDTVLHSGTSVQLSNIKNWKVWKKLNCKKDKVSTEDGFLTEDGLRIIRNVSK